MDLETAEGSRVAVCVPRSAQRLRFRALQGQTSAPVFHGSCLRGSLQSSLLANGSDSDGPKSATVDILPLLAVVETRILMLDLDH
jgi:hypothetical protein